MSTLSFAKIGEFRRGLLLELLIDAYSFDARCAEHWQKDWQVFDDFFFDNLSIANRYGFITLLGDRPIGLVSWDPRCKPEHEEIGHNGIRAAYKGNGYGVAQMKEALRRIEADGAKKAIVTTSGICVPAQHMYERAGFRLLRHRQNNGPDAFSGDYIDYECEFAKH